MAEGVTVAVGMNITAAQTGLAAMRKEFQNTHSAISGAEKAMAAASIQTEERRVARLASIRARAMAEQEQELLKASEKREAIREKELADAAEQGKREADIIKQINRDSRDNMRRKFGANERAVDARSAHAENLAKEIRIEERFVNTSRNTTNALRNQARETSKAGNNMLQLAYAADDAQYGMRGLMNNIPMLAQSIGLGAGLAGGVAILAVGLNLLATSWDKLTGSLKGVQDDATLTERAMENAKNRVVEAHRAIESESRRQEASNELLSKSVKETGDAFKSESEAIRSGLEYRLKMIDLTKELAEAEHNYALAKIAASGGTAEDKLRMEQAANSDYQNANAERKLEIINESIKAKQAEIEAEKRLGDEAAKRNAEAISAEFDIAKLKDDIAKAEKNADQERNRAMAIYQQTLNNFPGSAREFDLKGKSASDILAEAKAVQLAGFDKTVGSSGDSKIGALKELFFGGSEIEKSGEGLFRKNFSTGSMGYDGAGVLNITEIQAREDAAKLALDAAKAELAAVEARKSAIGTPESELKASEEKTAQMKQQLDILQKQQTQTEKLAKIESATLELQQKQAREELMKSAIQSAMNDKTSPIVDSISKIGGGGFIGSAESTNPLEKALREYKKQVKELQKSNDLLKQIRDKYPSYQP